MMYAILNQDKTDVREYRAYSVLPPTKPGYVIPATWEAEPPYNPTTQYLVEGQATITPELVTRRWLVMDRSQEEIDTTNENTLMQTRLDQLKQSVIWNKIKNDQDLTAAEIQQVLRFVVRYFLRNS